MRSIILTTIGVALAACATPDPQSWAGSRRAPLDSTPPWTAEFDPPTVLETARMQLEPLAPYHVQLDYAALMGSREHLQRTLRWGDWPRADFTVEENRADLLRHWQEFENGEGYAFTVLSPDRGECLGCVYLNPSPLGGARSAMLAYWVIERELAKDLDRHLLDTLLQWFEREWPFESVLIAEHRDNGRGLELARAAGLTPPALGDDQRQKLPAQLELLEWRRPGATR